ncbi:hypothetical protein PAPYR_11361 [Paratrimastix pyriformis]|uniref:Uncharacterized protein n=1 Tax=Paratrimastix pyriformis TaxID=342808 RepID=A0ABQ8U9K2_9EUKA|nr:hypothetical protein PAPYR_11361 [Paratrimastix pyriformis]
MNRMCDTAVALKGDPYVGAKSISACASSFCGFSDLPGAALPLRDAAQATHLENLHWICIYYINFYAVP